MPNSLSRFKKVTTAQTRPGCCFLCRTSTGPFIDTGINSEWDGAVYICMRCLKEMYNQSEFPVAEINDRYDEGFSAGQNSGKVLSMEALTSYVAEYASTISNSSEFDPVVIDMAPVESTEGKPKRAGKSKSNDDANVIGSSVNNVSDGPTSNSDNKSDSESGRADVPSIDDSGSFGISGIQF